MKREFDQESILRFMVEKTEEKYSGLCINCDKRKDCKIRNNECVIWHCEEYQ